MITENYCRTCKYLNSNTPGVCSKCYDRSLSQPTKYQPCNDVTQCECQNWARTDLTVESLNSPIGHHPRCQKAKKIVGAE